MASKEDLAKVTKNIDNLFAKLKQLSVVQAELARANIPCKASSSFTATENINSTIVRRDYLAKQAALTTKWILGGSIDEAKPTVPNEPP